tara:strand:+ start:1747 stop:1971 length:225 start_codon:yes stop_codon:yes gene_type:complete
MINKIIKLTFFYYIISISYAYAYLDPGTTGIIFSTLIGLIVAGITFMKNFFYKLKVQVYKILGKEIKIDNKEKK